MSHYSIKDAADLTGTSISSIRRFLAPIRDDSSNPLRLHVLPSVEEVVRLRSTSSSVQFSWKLSKQLLDIFMKEKELDYPQPKEKEESLDELFGQSEVTSGLYARMLEMLEESLRAKQRSIESHEKSIETLLDRQAETNVLLRNLQERLPSPANRNPQTDTTDDTKNPAQKKRGWMHRLLTTEIRVFR